MIFQILDDREQCFGVYSNGSFMYDKLPNGFDQTWAWNRNLVGKNIEYAQIWCQGKPLGEVGPPHLVDRFEVRSRKIKGFLRSMTNAKIRFDDVCLFEIVPDHHLRHYCEVKNEICKWIFENLEKPKNHQFMVDLLEMTEDISENIVSIDLNRLFRHSKNDRKAHYLFNQVKGEEQRVLYDVWGSITGRLTTKTGSFPILNLKKEIADCVIPKNDAFIQLDFNGAEIRTLLSLAGKEQPDGDIHEWNMKNIYHEVDTRAKAKQRFFAWLYNPNSTDVETEKFYNRSEVLNKYYNNGVVSTPFGREIQSDDFHALNYLLQSSSSDNCLHSAIKINKFLKSKQSFVHSVVHDSIIIDLKTEERQVLPTLLELFSDTKLGMFSTTVHIGKDLKNFERLSW